MKESSNKIIKRNIGLNFLHTHPDLENEKQIDPEHCIVDREDLEEAYGIFKNNPQLVRDKMHLLPCPMCGNKKPFLEPNMEKTRKRVICPNCGTQTVFCDPPEYAIKKWNIRYKED